jgi:hypothetical protein
MLPYFPLRSAELGKNGRALVNHVADIIPSPPAAIPNARCCISLGERTDKLKQVGINRVKRRFSVYPFQLVISVFHVLTAGQKLGKFAKFEMFFGYNIKYFCRQHSDAMSKGVNIYKVLCPPKHFYA